MNYKKHIFDIGAYDGLDGIIMAIKNPDILIHAFEANPEQIKKINFNKKKIEKFIQQKIKNYKINNLAVSNKNSYYQFNIAKNPTVSSLNKFSINQVIHAIKNNDRKLLSSVPGIGKKMTERIILELKSNLSISLNENEKPKDDSLQINDIKMISIIQDLDLTLQSLNYSKSEIKKVLPLIINNSKNKSDQINDEKNLTFENLLKLSMNYLDKENSNLDH